MSWLYDRKGMYYVGWRDPQGKCHGKSLGTRNKRVAEAALPKFKRERGADVPSSRPTPPRTVAHAVDLYLSSALARMRPATYRAVHARLQHGLAEFGDRKLGDLAPAEFEAYRDKRLRRRAPATVAGELKEWRTFFNWCIRQGWMVDNPAKVRSPRVPRNIPRYIDADDIPRYLEQAKEVSAELHAALMTALYTGLRRGELVWLEWEDVDFSAGLVYVRNKPGHPLKDYEERSIPLHEQLAEALRELPRRSRWCFPSPTGGRWDVDNFSKLQYRAKLPGFHAWRHTFASYLAMNGADVRTIQQLMGHSSLTTTERYMQVSPAHRERAVGRLKFPG